MKDNRLIFIGAALLAIGSFMPLTSVPLWGEITMYKNGEGDGVILLFLAAASVAISFTKYRKPLYGIGGLALLITFIAISQISEMKSKADQGIAFLNILADTNFANTEYMQIGFSAIILLVGGGLLVFCGSLKTGHTNSVDTSPPPIPESHRRPVVTHEYANAQKMPSKSVDDRYDQLKKLKELFDADILSKEEFEAEKKQILGQDK